MCPPGTFANASTATACQKCDAAAGYYSPANASTACLLCPAGASSTNITCTCNPGYYGSGLSCLACPANTWSTAGNTQTLLSCRCIGGYTCSYTKRIVATVRIFNMTQAQFIANYQATFVRGLANAAGVPIGQITAVALASGRRLLFQSAAIKAGAELSWGRTAPQELTAKFIVHGADQMKQLDMAKLGHAYDFAWEHDHRLFIELAR